MPTYEYNCTNCNTSAEEIRSISERNSPKECTTCGSPMERKISKCTFRLKGFGWARDGYTSVLGDHPKYKDGTWSQDDIPED